MVWSGSERKAVGEMERFGRFRGPMGSRCESAIAVGSGWREEMRRWVSAFAGMTSKRYELGPGTTASNFNWTADSLPSQTVYLYEIPLPGTVTVDLGM